MNEFPFIVKASAMAILTKYKENESEIYSERRIYLIILKRIGQDI